MMSVKIGKSIVNHSMFYLNLELIKSSVKSIDNVSRYFDRPINAVSDMTPLAEAVVYQNCI